MSVFLKCLFLFACEYPDGTGYLDSQWYGGSCILATESLRVQGCPLGCSGLSPHTEHDPTPGERLHAGVYRNLCRALGKTGKRGHLFILYSKDVLGRGTENTKVARPKGYCPCEVHSLVGMKNVNQRFPPTRLPAEGTVKGKCLRRTQSRGGWGGVDGCESEKSSGEEVVLQGETSPNTKEFG